MKKLFVFFALLFAVVGLTGCSVAEKTYVSDSFDYEIAEGLSMTDSFAANAAIEVAKGAYSNLEITFNADGTTGSGAKWTQDGSKLTIDGLVDLEFKVSGSKLVASYECDNYSWKAVLVVKK